MKFKQSPLALLVAGLSATLWAAEVPKTEPTESIKVEGKGVFAGGKMVYEEAARARATVTYKAIEEKAATSNAFQLIDKLPGVNAHSQDGSGLFGGTMTVRGFSSSQMGFTVDGAPVNDSGSYDVYPQEYVDAENLEEIYVTQGTTDNDAPQIGATGGNIGLVTQKPLDKFRLKLVQTFGSNNMYKTFARVDTGKVGPVKSYFSASQSASDKWRGEGDAKRFHFDAKSIWSLGEGSQLSAGVLYTKAENYFLRRARLSDWQANRYYDYDTVLPARKRTAGVADDESGMTNYYGLQRNPFENYVINLKGTFKLTPSVQLDVEPYFWYGKGGGSSGTTVSETAETRDASGKITRFAGMTDGGRDLNGDGDKLDKVLAYTLSRTLTHRPGITGRLSWNLGEHKLMAAVWHEEARHRQTRPHTLVGDDGQPLDVWADDVLKRNDGSDFNGLSGGLARNWDTKTTVTQFTLQDAFNVGEDWSFMLGVRTPHTKRDAVAYGALSESEQADFLSSRHAQDGVRLSRTWNQVLPNVSAKYAINERSHAFVALSKNARTPANFILYELIQDQTNKDTSKQNRDLAPEKSINLDIGYRYQGDSFNFNGSVFQVNFKDRQAQRVDDDGTRRNYNVGDTKKRGFELEFGTSQRGGVSFYGSASYIREHLLNDFVQYVGTTKAASGKSPETSAAMVALPTTGKTMTDTPKWLFALGSSYQLGSFSTGLGAKYTGKRYGDLMNQEAVPASTVWDLNMAYKFANMAAMKRPTLRLAVSNLFNKDYLAGIPSTQINAQDVGANDGLRVIQPGKNAPAVVTGAKPNYDIGAPRFISVSFSAEF